ncbi:MAG: transaldolase [Caldilineae bacterium]|nr:MAG: transaldolase [Caldilineae bacterium]
MTKLHEIYQLGQSIWLDFISRDILNDGTLDRLIDAGIRGVTSNPTIFDKAISGSDTYDETIAPLAAAGKDAFAIYDAISRADVGAAADRLRPLYDESDGGDGFVSIEVSPDLAYDTQGTVAEARRLWQLLDRPNIMIKVPATAEGIPAIRRLISEGINVNATLMFSLRDYDNVAFAYIEGLEERARRGEPLERVASVASFFVSRIDGVVDKQLAERGNTELQGKIAIANAKLAYARFKEVFSGDRWKALEAKGARYQRPLWASTSTKNPAYSDVLYLDNLIGPHTVNTLPLKTIEAALDHAVVARTVDRDVAEARAQIAALADLGIDFDQVTADLQKAGVKSFADSFHSLLATVATRARDLQPAS